MVYATCTFQEFYDDSDSGITSLRICIGMDSLPPAMEQFGMKGYFRDQIKFDDSGVDDEDKVEGLPFEISLVVIIGLNPTYDSAAYELLGPLAWTIYTDELYNDLLGEEPHDPAMMLEVSERNRTQYKISDGDALRMLMALNSAWSFIPR